MNKICGIAGQISSGKDVMAEEVIKQCNVLAYNEFLKSFSPDSGPVKDCTLWSKAAFGDALKKVMMDAFGVDINFIEEWKRRSDVPENYLMTVREALQFIGDGFRKIKPTVWMDLTLRNNTPIVISDIRYINEATAIKDRSGVCILLWRPGYENNIDHPSEKQLKPYLDYFSKNFKEGIVSTNEFTNLFDLFIINDGTLEDLYEKVKTIVIPFLKNRFWR